jgi:CheY-like chemotaxis protein
VLDGNEAARRIRTELGLRLPIVALTAGALVGERQRALDAGMDDFVSKPFDPQVLIRKVRRLVELKRGEPIPMAFDEAGAAEHSERRPILKSVDAGVVQQMFGDDIALFRSLLQRMLREHAGLALPIAAPVEDAGRRALAGRVHKLKGSAGMIGATNVMRLAGAAERALRESRPAAAVEGILSRLAAALVTLREEAGQSRDDAPGTQPAGSTTYVRVESPDLEELCMLLESQNLAAVDKFEQLAGALRGMFDTALFEGLHNAVENLEFQHGAELLRGAARAGFGTAACGAFAGP